MSAPSSFDEFRRRVGAARAPKFALPALLHAALAAGLAIALWGTEDRFGGSVAEALVTNSPFGKALIAAGTIALLVTGALGRRLLRPSDKPRWRWPLVIPALLLALGMLAFLSAAAKGVTDIGDARGTLGPAAVFMFSGFALGAGASIARVGFAFGAACLSLAAWVLAISAASERQGGSARFVTVPSLLVALAVIAGGLLAASPLDAWSAIAIGAAGAVALFLTRNAPGTAEGTADLVAAGLCLMGALVLAALFHWANPIVDAVRVGGLSDTSLAGMRRLATQMSLAEQALRAGLVIALGAGVAAVVIGAGRSGVLAGALRRAALVGLPALAAALVPLASVRVQIGKSAESLVAATKSTLPSDLELPRVPGKAKSEGFLGEALRMGSTSTSIGATHPSKPTESFKDAATCEAFALDVKKALDSPRVPIAIDRRVPYRNVACLLAALDRGLSGSYFDVEMFLLGELAEPERLPAPFADVVPPPGAWPVSFSSRAPASDKTLYAAKVDGWHLGAVPQPSSLEVALRALGEVAVPPSDYDSTDRGPFFVAAHPETPWQVVHEAVVRLSESGSVVLEPARHAPARPRPSESEVEPGTETEPETETEPPPLPELPPGAGQDTGKVTVGEVKGDGPASTRKLRAELAKQTAKLDQCYTAALERRGGIEGTFTATVAIATDGTVSSVKKKAATLKDATLLGCAASVFYGVRLGAEAEASSFTVTLRFELSED